MCWSSSHGDGVKGKEKVMGSVPVLAWLVDWMMSPFTELGNVEEG